MDCIAKKQISADIGKTFANVSCRTIGATQAIFTSDHRDISNYRVELMNKCQDREYIRRAEFGKQASAHVWGRSLRYAAAIRACALALTLGSVALSSMAAEGQPSTQSKPEAPITIQLKQYKVVPDDKGATKLVDASLVLPGDLVEYHAVYANRGKAALPVIATIPIPEAMVYVAESATASSKVAHTVAQKDSNFSTEPLQKTVTTSSGATLSQPVPYAAYRFVRWDLGKLASGSQVELSVRAQVSQTLVGEVNTEGRAALASSSPK